MIADRKAGLAGTIGTTPTSGGLTAWISKARSAALRGTGCSNGMASRRPREVLLDLLDRRRITNSTTTAQRAASAASAVYQAGRRRHSDGCRGSPRTHLVARWDGFAVVHHGRMDGAGEFRVSVAQVSSLCFAARTWIGFCHHGGAFRQRSADGSIFQWPRASRAAEFKSRIAR